MPTERRRWLLVSSACAVVVALLLLRTPRVIPGLSDVTGAWDLHKYLHMASAPFGAFHIAPFCWRIGLPLLARLLPLPPALALEVLSVGALLGAYVFMYAAARRAGLDDSGSALALALLVSMGCASKLVVRYPLVPDATVLFFTVAALWAVLADRDRTFCVLLALGVCFKESVLFAAALHYALRAERLVDLGRARKTLLLSLPAVAVLVAIRVALPAHNADPAYVASLPKELWLVQADSPDYAYGRLFVELGLPRLLHPTLAGVRDDTVGVFGIVSLAAIGLGLRRTGAMLARCLPFLGLVYLQLLFAESERRLIALGAPIVALLAANGFVRIAERSRTRVGELLPIPVALFAILLAEYQAVTLRSSHELVGVAAGAAGVVFARFVGARRGPDGAPAGATSGPTDGSRTS